MANKTVTVRQSGGTYTTLAAAIAGELTANADLTTMDGILTISIEGDWSGVKDTTNVVVTGFTTDATRYLVITTDAANAAVKTGLDITRYILSVANNHALELSDDYTRVNGLQIEITDISANNQSPLYIAGIGASNYFIISNCRFTGNNDATYRSRALFLNDSDIVADIYNCISEGCQGASGSDTCYINCGTVNIHNSIFYNAQQDGIEVGAGTVNVYHTVIFKTGDDWSGTFGTVNYTASDDGGEGTNDVAANEADADWTTDFAGAATGNFTLLTGSPLKLGGTSDLSGGLCLTDIEGDTYNATTRSLGVDEFVAPVVGGISIPVVMHHLRQQGIS